jgi:transcriptional regulator with XRE-family HTH domain
MIATAEKVISAKDTDIKNRIEKVLLESGMNKSEFARNMGVTPNYLAAVLTNPTKGVSATLLKGLAEMGVNVNWLVTGKGDPLTGNNESFKERAEKAEARILTLESDLEKINFHSQELKKWILKGKA